MSVNRSDNNLFATLSNLHKGTGMGIGSILVVDTLAGSVILLSLSGVLLWTLMSRRRMVGLAIGGASLLATLGLALQSWQGRICYHVAISPLLKESHEGRQERHPAAQCAADQ